MRRVARIRGTVQGVGFRPAVARLAGDLGLAGFVRNDGAEVWIEVEGDDADVDAFERRLLDELPPAARVDAIAWDEAADEGGTPGFVIAGSTAGGRARVAIPPDLVTCADCAAEVRDPGRRQGYPFTNCTRCGPRYTIVASVPYDRPATAMAGFPMCADCAREYADPRDRRYHAQPIACPACGPRLWLRDADGALGAGGEALDRARTALRDGRIVALKGLGGWQLLVDATSDAAVRRLRERKRREGRPFAVLVSDLAAAREQAHLDEVEAAALASVAGPIVLVRKRGRLADAVAPGLARVGLMLPTTPLHRLVLDGLGFPVVCTSGNLHDEPIATGDDEALRRLSGIADLRLGHDRPILRRCDDAVVHVVDGIARTLRLGRGLGPASIPLPDGPDLLAVGGHLKCAPAAAIGVEAVLWPHVGDLDGLLAREALVEALAAMRGFLGLDPVAVVHDAHPDYGSTRVAEELGLPRLAVGHHHAHVAAALAEHGLTRGLGFAWDGVGLGDDGTAWGGEVLEVGPEGARRVAHLLPFPLPGGDAAARDGRRALAGVLVAAGMEVPPALEAFARIARSPLAPRTTSAGRLFDAVAALLGVRERSRFEGEAAIALEQVAGPPAEPYPFRLEGPVIDWRPALAGLLADQGDAPRAASRFHAVLAHAIAAVAVREGARTVVLAGGCFQNVRLTDATLALLRDRGIDARLPARVPPGDGGLALGQLWVARTRGA